MADLEESRALELDALGGRERIEEHAALDLDPDRLVGAVVEQEIKRHLVEEVGREEGALAKAHERPDDLPPVERRRSRTARQDDPAHGDGAAIGERAQLRDARAAPARDEAVQAIRQPDAARAPRPS